MEEQMLNEALQQALRKTAVSGWASQILIKWNTL
jgi:hypothetical protein